MSDSNGSCVDLLLFYNVEWYEILMVFLCGLVIIVSWILAIVSTVKVVKFARIIDIKYKTFLLTAAILSILGELFRFVIVVLGNHELLVKNLDTENDIFVKITSACNWSETDFFNIKAITYVIGSSVFVLVFVFLYLTYWRRLCLLFKNSIFAVSKRQRIILYTFAILLALFGVIEVTFGFFAGTLKSGFFNLFVFAAILCFLMFVIASCYLSVLLFKKLTFTINMKHNLAKNDKVSHKSKVNREIEINLVIRLTVLVSFSTATSIAAVLFFALMTLTNYNTFVVGFLNVILNCDVIANLLCLFLQFTFYDNEYRKLCSICHNYFIDRYKNSKLVPNQDNNDRQLPLKCLSK